MQKIKTQNAAGSSKPEEHRESVPEISTRGGNELEDSGELPRTKLHEEWKQDKRLFSKKVFWDVCSKAPDARSERELRALALYLQF